MKIIFILLLCFLTAHTAHAEGPDRLPDRFLGVWEGAGRATAGWAIDIRADGIIYWLTPEKREYDSLDNYRFITVDAEGQAYILHYNTDKYSHKTRVRLIRFSVKDETGNFGPGDRQLMHTLNRYSGFCSLDIKGFATRTREELTAWLHGADCDVDNKRSGPDFENYVRYEPIR